MLSCPDRQLAASAIAIPVMTKAPALRCPREAGARDARNCCPMAPDNAPTAAESVLGPVGAYQITAPHKPMTSFGTAGTEGW